MRSSEGILNMQTSIKFQVEVFRVVTPCNTVYPNGVRTRLEISEPWKPQNSLRFKYLYLYIWASTNSKI